MAQDYHHGVRVVEVSDGTRPIKEIGEILRPGKILCNLLQVTGVGIGVDDESRHLMLRWTPAGEKAKRTEAIPMRDIGDREGWARLRAGGLFITANPRLRKVLADHLLRDTANRELRHIASVTGWQCGAYIMPDGEIIGTPETPVMFNGPVLPLEVIRFGERFRAGAQRWAAWLVAITP